MLCAALWAVPCRLIQDPRVHSSTLRILIAVVHGGLHASHASHAACHIRHSTTTCRTIGDCCCHSCSIGSRWYHRHRLPVATPWPNTVAPFGTSNVSGFEFGKEKAEDPEFEAWGWMIAKGTRRMDHVETELSHRMPSPCHPQGVGRRAHQHQESPLPLPGWHFGIASVVSAQRPLPLCLSLSLESLWESLNSLLWFSSAPASSWVLSSPPESC